MKLSEALRKGSEGQQQIRCRSMMPHGCCALGAIARGYGAGFMSNTGDVIDFIQKQSGVDMTQLIEMPMGKKDWEGQKDPLSSALFTLNDCYLWEFDQIITWLEEHEL